MAVGEITTKRWTTGEYYRIAEVGLLDAERSELIEGEIFMMSPLGGRHAQAVSLLLRSLQTAFGSDCHVRVQSPLHLSEYSEPEPDLAVISGDPRDYPDHPTTALLVAEISDSSIAHDRDRKQLLYSRAGIVEYWIVNLVTSRLEVFRQPADEGYLDAQVYSAGDSLAPVTLPAVSIAVSSFLA
jgi:Uma2 family endonuclease